MVESTSCLQNELDLIGVWRIKNPRTKSFDHMESEIPVHMLRYVVVCCPMLCYTCMSRYVGPCFAV